MAHAPVNPGYDEGSAVLLSQTYLLLWLHPDLPVVRLPHLGDVDAMFAPFRQEHLRGANLDTFLRPRLLEPCDPRSALVRDEDDFQSAKIGRAFMARRLRTHWGYDVPTQAKSSSSSTTMA